VYGIILVASAALACSAGPGAAADSRSSYSTAVARICAGSRLFAGRHEIGTRAGAIAVSKDIRRTGLNRLRRVDHIAKPRAAAMLDARWISQERQLVELYANTYLRIWYVIERYETPRLRATLPARLRALIDLPRPLEKKVRRLEERLNVPDCTGGIPPKGVSAQ
jgi:hypothetical protein